MDGERGFESSIEIDDQERHEGDEGDFGGLASSQQVLKTISQSVVVTGGDQRRDVERLAQGWPATTNPTLASQGRCSRKQPAIRLNRELTFARPGVLISV